MKLNVTNEILLALALAILPAISLADGLPNQILWNKDGAEMAYICLLYTSDAADE